MAKDLNKSIEALGKTMDAKRDKNIVVGAAPSPKIVAVSKRRTGKSIKKIAKAAEKKISDLVESLKIQQFDLFPSREYPTPFTRIPLFTPCQRKKARALESKKTINTDFIRLNSVWDKGGVFKSGPPLTVFDEDTFIGLLYLRKKGLKGKASSMPSKKVGGGVSTISPTNEQDVLVHSGYFLISELETLIKGTPPPKEGWGGRALKERRESVERIGATILKFTQPQNLDKYRGKQIQIVSIDWIADKHEAYYYFEFHPAVVLWLNEFRTYIDLNIRRKLTPFGKALHRFLSSQKSNKHYKKDWDDVLTAIGFEGRSAEAKRKAIVQLQLLVTLDFIKKGEIKGNGRREPYMLHVSF